MLRIETVPSTRCQANRLAASNAAMIAVPPGYWTPTDRSKKSAIVVPSVVVATMVAQYSAGWKREDRTCDQTSATKIAAKMPVPTR